MGFSVSGSFALIAIGTLVAFGMVMTAGSNTVEQVTDAQQQVRDEHLVERNTAIEFGNVSYNASGGTLLVIEVINTGSTSLDLNATDVIVDNVLQTDFELLAVEGATASDVWLPGETLRIEIDRSTRPERVKVVTGGGVAISTEVS